MDMFRVRDDHLKANARARAQRLAFLVRGCRRFSLLFEEINAKEKTHASIASHEFLFRPRGRWRTRRPRRKSLYLFYTSFGMVFNQVEGESIKMVYTLFDRHLNTHEIDLVIPLPICVAVSLSFGEWRH